MIYSELEAEWHPTENLPLVFNMSLTISRKYWWICKSSHKWQATLDKRQRGGGCPYCSNTRVLLGFNDLATVHPDIAAEWHPIKNGELQPIHFTFGSEVKVWWLGKCGHEWEAIINRRTRKAASCLVCRGHKVLIGFNDLATLKPYVASEWHPTKNGELTALEIIASSNQRIWWLCKNDATHEWVAIVKNRTKQNATGCPKCYSKRPKTPIRADQISLTNSPFIAEWHPTRNGELTPRNITKNRLPKLWWLCEEGHEWEATLSHRRKGAKCPFCSTNKLIPGVNDLATTHPVLSAEWHPTKNIWKPTEVSSGSQKKVWWLGQCDHEWQSSPNQRSHRFSGTGCPFCTGRKVLVGFNDLATTHPYIASEWHPIKNGNLTSEQITAGSSKKVWWLGKCGHDWETSPTIRSSRNQGCIVCSGYQILIGYNDFATVYPEAAAEWHPTKNGDLLPEQFISSSRKKVWWFCSEGHEWETSIRIRSEGSGCSVCAGRQINVGHNDLATVHPTMAAQWHPTKNGKLTPHQVTIFSSKKVWWKCELGHEWETILSGRTSQDRSCPTCINRRLLTGFNDFATKNPHLVSEWHPTKNSSLIPSKIPAGSNEKVWWLCPKKHEWEATVRGRNVGYGCPTCTHPISKAELQIKEFLESFNLTVEGSNRTILGGKEIDLWIPTHNIGIEFNGIYWHTEKRRGKALHYDKYLAAQKAGIELIQIWEDDWNQKQEVVKRMLAQKLGVAELVLAEETSVITVTEQQAEEFLKENHLQGYEEGSHYLGLVNKRDIETLQAVMVLDEEPETDGKMLNILRYATSANVIVGFAKLMSFAAETFSPDSFVAVADHCVFDSGLYEGNGFIVEKVIPPDYMYVVKNERKHRSEYPLERFHSDPKLLWEEGLTEMELADLNGLDRIWDAGKTRYRLSLK